jgi:hypothetical protein
VTDCRRYSVEPVSRTRLEARCSCGWRSQPCVTAGLAGTAWDRHVRDTERAELVWVGRPATQRIGSGAGAAGPT